MKKNTGITLVALVITIIILLILAGVAISMITGGEGLFAKANDAATKYNQAAKNEVDQIQSLTNVLDSYLNGTSTGEPDTVDPTVAIIEASNIYNTTFTLTARGEDETEIAKYEFYINGILEKTVITREETVIYNVTGKTVNETYVCKVIVYDKVGNFKESEEITVETKTISINIGDYVNYDAGTWTSTDLAKITSSVGSPTLHGTVNDEMTGNQALPKNQGEFGGFEIGQSRNTNSTEYSSKYKPRTAGWRVWSVDESTEEVTLISAGNPETYYHSGVSGSTGKSMEILQNRDCSMYLNGQSYAKNARIITGQDAVKWYNEQYKTNYSIKEYNKDSSFHDVTFSRNAPIEVLENGSYYWLASAATEYRLFSIKPDNRIVSWGMYNCALGVRILITLDSNVLTPNKNGKTDVTTWDILELEN